MGGKPPLGHRALLSKGKEDEKEMFGYRTRGFRRALCAAGHVLSCGALLLLFHWKPEWAVWASCEPCDLAEADVVLLRATDEFRRHSRKKVARLDLSQVLDGQKLDLAPSAERGSVISKAIVKPQMKVRYIQVQKIRYVWDHSEKQFVRVGSLEDSSTCSEIHRRFGDGLTEKEKELRKLVCGPNTIEIEIRPVWKLLFKEILNPFYVFQAFTLTLWLVQGYIEYSIAIIILSILSIALTVYDLRQQSVKLHNLVQEHNRVQVTVWTKDKGGSKSESCHLVPGDVLLLESQKLSLPCDAILLEGSCVVNESMLTGESVPVVKTALASADSSVPWQQHGMEDYRRHVLFCGTEVIQTRRAGKGPARAVVLQTGFSTAKGDLVRSILYPKPMNFRLYREAFWFIVCLAVIGVLGLVYAVCVYSSHKQPASSTVAMALLLLTVAVPPAIPAALTTGIVCAQRRLTRKRIFCVSPQRINVCGQINLVCFDKTGTLTEDGLDLWGVTPCQKGSFGGVLRFPGSPLPWGPLCRAMATCHSLFLLDGKIQGDPLDLKMFEGTKWELEESGPAEDAAGLLESHIVVKPGPDASQAPVEGIAILRQFPFSSSLLRMSVVTQDLGKDVFDLYMKGAPEVVANLCEPATVPANFQTELEYFTSQGFRVLALAHKELAVSGGVGLGDVDRESLEAGLTFLGLLVMENRLKSETVPVLEELSDARIRSVMVTGDNLQTAIAVARNSGMICSGSRIIQVEACEPEKPSPASITWQLVEELHPGTAGSQPSCFLQSRIPVELEPASAFHFALSGRSYQVLVKHFRDLLPKVLMNGTVFARMAPAQKSSLVEEFQKLDYYVGMCGDGANDCGALKAAHAGISLSEQEASVASPFTSQTPNIQCVPELIREGRASLVASFAVFKYLTLYGMVQFIGTALLYWQMQIFGNFQYLLQDVCITLVVCLTMSLTAAYPRLAPYRPPGRLLSPPLLLSVTLNVGFALVVQVFAFLYVKQQPWYAKLRSHR
ncbi:probable cation-transporting ATPase 13A5 [Varanus komodoensis]|uniref:probable cation-transporting ATPase 13A5 n=1 Tax=Varanus komodoensis TaxID=61221 RepID=UPI001CF7B915|nr:probable cation-transporting ATPase 13A5 [Varanus komodoensis]